MTNSQFKQSRFRSIRVFGAGIYFCFSSLRAILGCLVCCVAVCLFLSSESRSQSWGLKQREAGMEKWQHPLRIPLKEVQISLILHLCCMLSSRCLCVELLRIIHLPQTWEAPIVHPVRIRANWAIGSWIHLPEYENKIKWDNKNLDQAISRVIIYGWTNITQKWLATQLGHPQAFLWMSGLVLVGGLAKKQGWDPWKCAF